MKTDLIASIEKMIVNGNRLDLPEEQLSNYPAVKKALVAAGGKYKKNGFVFTKDPQKIKDRLCGGEIVNDKKKYQQFFTPPDVADHLIELADLRYRGTVLEPSAGEGHIADRLDVGPFALTLQIPSENTVFDRIIANPPFAKGQDIAHITHMYEFLRPGGRLVSVASASVLTGQTKKQIAFREWVYEMGGLIEPLPDDSFKASGTRVRTCVVVIDKAEGV